jgi:hypothetical protein
MSRDVARLGGHSLAIVLAVLALVCALAAPAGATAPYAMGKLALASRWTHSLSRTLPRPEYPRPQFERAQWLNLNGRWQYEQATAGQRPPFRQALAQTILVPYPVQSGLSGIERDDPRGWYRRTFSVPRAWKGQHVLLNFGAVSWATRVWINGRLAGSHRGDYDAFSFDISRLLREHGPNELVVGYVNPIGAADEPVGKQVPGTPSGIYHSASSGIWQTVWLEPVSAAHFTNLVTTPDVAHDRLLVDAPVTGHAPGATVQAQALAGGRVVATAAGRPGQRLTLEIPHPRLWSPSHPSLYGLRLELGATHPARGHRKPTETVFDRVQSYFGMRSISLGRVGGATRILLNGNFVFETGALDQGYWPDGLYAAPTDAADRFDIAAAKRLGYDMLREHVKVQDDRWYYWADRLGILVWQDMPNPPVRERTPPTAFGKAEFRRELSAIVSQHRSNPSIVMWVAFNEGWDQFDEAQITHQIRRLDPTRLVDTDSGSANCCNATQVPSSSVFDTHLYFGPFAVHAGRHATVIGEYGGVLPFPPPGHAWPGVLTSIGSPALSWPLTIIDPYLRQQYAELGEEMRLQGLSGAVFTELANYEDELGILSYDREVYGLPPGFVHGLNRGLIDASERSTTLRPIRAMVPGGTSGLWRFDEGRGLAAADTSGHGHTLTLQAGAGWRPGVHGHALAIGAPGQSAAATGPVLDATNSFTVSAWLEAGVPGESGTAVSEPGLDGSAFSLGIQTAPQGAESLSGEVGHRSVLSAGTGTWWTFAVPAAGNCTISLCGVRANMRYDDGRFDPRPWVWHQETGVYNRGTATVTVYVDGVPEDVEHVDSMPPATGAFTVGAGSGAYSSTDTFVGGIDDVRTYGRALSPLEVAELYRAERR